MVEEGNSELRKDLLFWDSIILFRIGVVNIQNVTAHYLFSFSERHSYKRAKNR